jgi:hypothetical protein
LFERGKFSKRNIWPRWRTKFTFLRRASLLDSAIVKQTRPPPQRNKKREPQRIKTVKTDIEKHTEITQEINRNQRRKIEMVGKLKTEMVDQFIDPPPKSIKLAAAIAVLIFELEEEIRTNGTWNIGADFFTKFISANLGSLVSQGLLNGDHKIRYFGSLQRPPSLIISGPLESLDRLTEAWKNRLLKAPVDTKLLSYGLVNNFGMDSIVQRQNIKLADLVLMAIADLNSMKLLAQPSTIRQHLESKCEEMNIPNTKAIEYCISELVKSKKIYFNSDGGYRLEIKSFSQNLSRSKTPQPVQSPTPIPKKLQAQKSKRKTFSFDFTKKIKNSLRRKTFSPIPIRAKSPNSAKNNVNQIKEIPLADSGIDHSLPSSLTPINPSMTSTASQVTTPNWSDSNENNGLGANTSVQLEHHQNNNVYESPLRLQARSPTLNETSRSPSPGKTSRSPIPTPAGHEYTGKYSMRSHNHSGRISDAESVASSCVRNGSGKVMKRKASRRRAKPRSSAGAGSNPSPETIPFPISNQKTGSNLPKPNMETPTAPRRTSKMFENSQNISRSNLDEEIDDILAPRRFIRSSDETYKFPPPPPEMQNESSAMTHQTSPTKIDSEDSIFGEESEHVDDFSNENGNIKRTNSITFNIKKGGLSDSLTFEQINSPPVTRRDLRPLPQNRSKTPVSIFAMKEQLQSHIERQRTRQRPRSCHPAFQNTPSNTTAEHPYHARSHKSDQRDNRYSGMWNKPRSHSPASPMSPTGASTQIYKSPTLIKANFTPPTSPQPKSQKTSSQVQLRSKTPAPRPAPRTSQRERPKSVNPERMLAGPSGKMNPSSKQLSLEVLEQLSLTRQEWIEYFKSKKTPERLRNEINQLQGGTSKRNHEDGSATEDSGINSPKNRTSPMFKYANNLKPVHWTNV